MARELNAAPIGTSIKRLLRCRKTYRYFTGDGWTDDPHQAKAFADEIDAMRAGVENQLEDIELVLCPSGSTTDLFTTRIR